jgi:putative sigma-54 modulation protein
MNIIIKGLHMDLTEAIENYLLKKVKTLSKFIDEESKLEAVVGKNSKHHKSGKEVFKAELRASIKGEVSQVKAEAEDLYSAIDMARDELNDLLSSKKDKKQTLTKKGAQTIKKMVHAERVKKPKKKLTK